MKYGYPLTIKKGKKIMKKDKIGSIILYITAWHGIRVNVKWFENGS
jgi:hypothetical protein